MPPAQRKQVLTIKDEPTLKVIADPLRRRILLHLGGGRSIGDVAVLLDETPQRLHYHFGLLARHGLITEAGRRQNANHIEKLWRPAAASFRIEPKLAAAVGYGVNLAVQTVLEESVTRYSQARSALERTGRAEHFPSTQLILGARLTRDQIATVQAELRRLSESFRSLDEGNDEGRCWYGLTVVFHPAGPDPTGTTGIGGNDD